MTMLVLLIIRACGCQAGGVWKRVEQGKKILDEGAVVSYL